MLDVNQTRHHLLLGATDWAPLADGDTGLEWYAALECIRLEAEVFRFPSRPADRINATARRGAAADRYGSFFWISEDRTAIRHLPTQGVSTVTYWPVADPGRAASAATDGGFRPLELEPTPIVLHFGGLAVTEDHYLVAGVDEPEPGLLVFDLHGGGPPERHLWPVPFQPVLLAARPGGGLLVVDRIRGGPTSPPAWPRLWKLTRWLRIEGRIELAAETDASDFLPKEPAAARPTCVPHEPRRLVSGDAFELVGVSEPVAAFEPGPGGLVVVDAESGLHGFNDHGNPVGNPVDLSPLINAALADDAVPAPFVVHAAAYLRDTATLYVVGPDGNQAFAFQISFDREAGVSVTLDRQFLPLRRFSGRALVANRGAVYYDYGERWYQLIEQPRPQFKRAGTLLAGPFDGRQPGTVWHRLVLDASIPQGTAVMADFRCADELAQLGAEPWQTVPPPYLRGAGSELPFQEALAGEEDRCGTWETLFQQAKGRHLLLRLQLNGSGRRTPRVHALRLYYPRFSYARAYLPAVYRHDATSASFLDRFLANVEGSFTDLEGRVANVEQLFDVDACPAEFLDWLGSWLGAGLEADWDAARRRLFLRHAIELFRQRGTRRGLLRLIRLATDPCVSERLFTEDLDDPANALNRFGVRLVEAFQTGDYSPHRFAVSAPITPGQDVEAQQRYLDQVRRVVERERPAHTEFEVQPFWALFRVGSARTGYDTQLGPGSRFTALILGDGRLARSYLGTAYPYSLANRRVTGALKLGRQPCAPC